MKITECGIDYVIEYGNDNVRNVLLRHIEQLQESLDDLLETCELAGMHDDLTYRQCKATYLASTGGRENTDYLEALKGYSAWVRGDVEEFNQTLGGLFQAVEKAIAEIERLRVAFRHNILRLSHDVSHEEIDRILRGPK